MQKEYPFIAQLASFIGQERVSQGMTQEQLAQKCCMHRVSLARIDSYESSPSLWTAVNILDKLGYELHICQKERN